MKKAALSLSPMAEGLPAPGAGMDALADRRYLDARQSLVALNGTRQRATSVVAGLERAAALLLRLAASLEPR